MAYQNLYNSGIRSRRWEPDAIFGSYWFNKFIGLFIKHGKRLRAEKLVFSVVKCFKKISKRASFYLSFMTALRRLRPVIGLGRRRHGLIMIDTPYVIKSTRGYKMIFRWIIDCIKARPERRLHDRLFSALTILFKPKGVFQSRYTYLANLQESTQYAHFRWV